MPWYFVPLLRSLLPHTSPFISTHKNNKQQSTETCLHHSAHASNDYESLYDTGRSTQTSTKRCGGGSHPCRWRRRARTWYLLDALHTRRKGATLIEWWKKKARTGFQSNQESCWWARWAHHDSIHAVNADGISTLEVEELLGDGLETKRNVIEVITEITHRLDGESTPALSHHVRTSS